MSLSGEKKLKLKREWLLQMDNDAEDPIQTSNSTRASQQVPQEEWAEGFAMTFPVSWPKIMYHPGISQSFDICEELIGQVPKNKD